MFGGIAKCKKASKSPKMGFYKGQSATQWVKVKVQRGGTKNIAYVSAYNKTKSDTRERCCLSLLLCTRVQNKTTNC